MTYLPDEQQKRPNHINDLPIFIDFIKVNQESFIEVIAQILLDNQFLTFSKEELDTDFIDLKNLLKSDTSLQAIINEDKK